MPHRTLSNENQRSQTVCFFAPVDDPTKLSHIGFYRQDIDALQDLGYEVIIATSWHQIPWNCDYYFIWWWTWAFKPLFKAKARGKPTIITGTFNLNWGNGDYFHRPIHHRLLLRAALSMASLNLFVSRHELDPIVKMAWTKSAMYSPHCVDTDLYSPGTDQRDPNLLVTIGWLRKENAIRKGMPDIIRALPRILQERPETRLMIVGEEGSGSPFLADLAEDLGVTEAITFTGKVNEQTKLDLLRSCAAYVQPSHYEGFGLAILEAMSCGAAVVTCAVGAVEEVVGDTGKFAEHTPDSIAECVLSILSDETAADALRNAARGRACRYFPLNRRKQDIKEALAKVKRE